MSRSEPIRDDTNRFELIQASTRLFIIIKASKRIVFNMIQQLSDVIELAMIFRGQKYLQYIKGKEPFENLRYFGFDLENDPQKYFLKL